MFASLHATNPSTIPIHRIRTSVAVIVPRRVVIGPPMLWITLMACQEPFAFDRRDLRGTRVAAVTLEVGTATIRPRAHLVVDGHLWSDRALSMEWAWIDGVGGAADFPTPVATGVLPVLDRAGDRLALRVRDGTTSLMAEIDVQDQREGRYRLGLLDLGRSLDELTAEELAIDVRADWTGRPADVLAPGGVGRFAIEGMEEDARARFMATGEGTFFELDATTADWVAGSVRVDDDELVDREPLTERPFTVLGLVLGDANGVALRDAFVGDPPAGSWVDGRFVAGGLPGPFTATLVADDTASLGLIATDVVPGDDGTGTIPPCMGDAVDLLALVDHRCLRATLDGQRVFLDPSP
jgi:hypothetical protein